MRPILAGALVLTWSAEGARIDLGSLLIAHLGEAALSAASHFWTGAQRGTFQPAL